MERFFVFCKSIMKKTLTSPVVIVGLVLYLLSATGSFAAFNALRGTGEGGTAQNPADTSLGAGKSKLIVKKKPDLPKTEECPLSGEMLSAPEREAWEKRRPLGVMIENSKVARNQSGLSSADWVYEAVAEGGITRFLAVYYCQDSDVIGPVRSARTYYIDWLSEYGNSPLYAHVGGANQPGPADALGQIKKYGWGAYNDMDQFSVSFPTYWLDTDRLGKDTPTEHSYYTSSTKLWTYAANKRALTNVEADDVTGKQLAWNATFVKRKFKDDVALPERPAVSSVEFGLSNTQSSYMNDYTVRWQYDPQSNSYLRFNGSVEHRDLNTNQQLTAKNIVIQFMAMTVADDGYDEAGHGTHTLYGNKGTGTAVFLIDGKVMKGFWKKKDRVSMTIFTDDTGAEVKFNRGVTWVETLPIGQQLKQS